jgi:hypothetical protein
MHAIYIYVNKHKQINVNSLVAVLAILSLRDKVILESTLCIMYVYIYICLSIMDVYMCMHVIHIFINKHKQMNVNSLVAVLAILSLRDKVILESTLYIMYMYINICIYIYIYIYI